MTIPQQPPRQPKEAEENPSGKCYTSVIDLGKGRLKRTRMTSSPAIDASLRKIILSDPETLLDDADIMNALVAANEKALGGNIVDLRGIAMQRLEARLDRLEDTHRSVIAAAYENLAGTNQIHRAVLRLLEATRFDSFLNDLGGDVANILRVDCVRLVLETESESEDPVIRKVGDVLAMAESGFVNAYLGRGRNGPIRQVTLRQIKPEEGSVYGEKGDYIRSEACLRLDLGEKRLPGMLLLGAEDPHLFTPQQGTDLLTFFAGVFERSMRRWLD
jgi:uncharacterized protein YigA (DUF484 family)